MSNVNPLDDDENTPLHVTAAVGDVEIAQIILQRHANLNSLNMSKQSPLFVAAEAGHTEIVELLLRAGASVILC